MNIQVKEHGVKKTHNFNLKEIINQFHSLEEVEEVRVLIQKKLEDFIKVTSLKKSFLSNLKVAYLLKFRHLDFILNGLLKMAEEECEAISKK